MKVRGRPGPFVHYCTLPAQVALLILVIAPFWTTGHMILWGRCYSYCLKEHLLDSQSPDGTESTLPKHPIRTCQRHPTCKWCLYVCERPEKNFTNTEYCLRDCMYTRTGPGSSGRRACTDACSFLRRASSAKGGTCPAPVSLNGFQSACVTSCQRDRDCSKTEEKCCSNSCGTICTAPYDIHLLPPVPSKITFKLLRTGGVMVKWGLTEDDDWPSDQPEERRGGNSPVVYILRWWCTYTSGALTTVTDKERTKLQGYPSGIYPGSTCHFMVAAVNSLGSRGFSKVSPYIKKFLVPSAPLHLDEVESTLHDGKVDVTIQWQPPVYTDGLPVYRYEVYWSDRLPRASPHYMRLHMHRRNLAADQHSFVLEGLEPGTMYFVQVRAVVQWKRQQKRGKLASTYIETYSPPIPAESDQDTEFLPEVDTDLESVIHSVKVEQTFFYNTILKTGITWTLKPELRRYIKALTIKCKERNKIRTGRTARKYLIYWRLEVCAHSEDRQAHQRKETSATSHERSFTLYHLQPNCEYSVNVHAVDMNGRTGAATVTNFVTPPCHLINVTEGESPVCHTADVPEPISGLHSETTRCMTVVRWEPAAEEGADVNSYEVTWGESKSSSFSLATVIYSSPPYQRTLPANTTHVQLGHLTGGQHYSVQVRAASAGGLSQPAVLHLTAPTPNQPCGSVEAAAAKWSTGFKRHDDSLASNSSHGITNDVRDTHNASLGLPAGLSIHDVTVNRSSDVSLAVDVLGCCNETISQKSRDHQSGNSRKGITTQPTPFLTSHSTPYPSPSPDNSIDDSEDDNSQVVLAKNYSDKVPQRDTTTEQSVSVSKGMNIQTQFTSLSTVNNIKNTTNKGEKLGRETSVEGKGMSSRTCLVTLFACLLLLLLLMRD